MSEKLFDEETSRTGREEAVPEEERDRALDGVLQQVSGQLRLSLGNIHSALVRLAPPEARDGDRKTDLDAAVLCQSYYRILRLTNNLADAAEAGRPQAVKLRNGDIAAFCRGVMERAEAPAELLGIRTGFRCEKRGHIIAMNEERLERLLLNLLSNAFKFIRPDEKKVTLELKVEREFVRLVLTDTGVGMTPAELATAYDRCRLTERQDPPPHGLGLGLPICRRIAAEHGGTILLTSTPGVGTTATVSLPNRKLPQQAGTQLPAALLLPDIYGGFNKTLVELSDALKRDAFTQKYLD